MCKRHNIRTAWCHLRNGERRLCTTQADYAVTIQLYMERESGRKHFSPEKRYYYKLYFLLSLPAVGNSGRFM